MGLLDIFDNPDAQLGLGLLAAASPRADAAGFGQRLMEGVQGAQGMRDAQMKRKMYDMQMQESQLKLADAQRAADIQKWTLENAPKFFRPSIDAQPAQFQDVPQIPQPAPAIANPMALDPAQTRQLPPAQQLSKPAVQASPASFDQAGFLESYAQKDPLAAMQLMQRDNTPVVVPEGGSLYTKNGTFLAMGSPKREPVPAELQGYALALKQGYKGSFLDYQVEQKRAGATNISTKVINAGPQAFETELGKLDAEQLGDWRKNAQSAQSTLSTVAQLRNASNNGAYSGGAANLKMTAANFINGITGAVPKGLVGSQEYNAAASNLVLEKIKTLGANPSNADREFIEKTVPQLSQSLEARTALANFLETKARQSIDLYQRADAHARKNHGLSGFSVVNSGDTSIDDLIKKWAP